MLYKVTLMKSETYVVDATSPEEAEDKAMDIDYNREDAFIRKPYYDYIETECLNTERENYELFNV